MIWYAPIIRHKRCQPVRRIARILARIERSDFKPVRPRRMKPGPYKDANGNLCFLGRDKTAA